jgi:hypothetical protein
MVMDNLDAGCTGPGVLGVRIQYNANSFEIGDCSGAPVWVRNLQFTAVAVEVPFTYQEPNGTTQNGTVMIPAGSPVEPRSWPRLTRSTRVFSGIDDVANFDLTCKTSTISAFGQKVILDDDERIEPGTVVLHITRKIDNVRQYILFQAIYTQNR